MLNIDYQQLSLYFMFGNIVVAPLIGYVLYYMRNLNERINKAMTREEVRELLIDKLEASQRDIANIQASLNLIMSKLIRLDETIKKD